MSTWSGREGGGSPGGLEQLKQPGPQLLLFFCLLRSSHAFTDALGAERKFTLMPLEVFGMLRVFFFVFISSKKGEEH